MDKNNYEHLRVLKHEQSKVNHLSFIIRDLTGQFEDIFTVIKGRCQMILLSMNGGFNQEDMRCVIDLIDRASVLIQQLYAVSKLLEGINEGFSERI